MSNHRHTQRQVPGLESWDVVFVPGGKAYEISRGGRQYMITPTIPKVHGCTGFQLIVYPGATSYGPVWVGPHGREFLHFVKDAVYSFPRNAAVVANRHLTRHGGVI